MNEVCTLRKVESGMVGEILNLQDIVFDEIINKDNLRHNTKEMFVKCTKEPNITLGIYDKSNLAGIGIVVDESGNEEDLSIGLRKYKAVKPINMKLIMIRKEYYGRGFQRALMWILEKLSVKKGYASFCTTVSPSNTYSINNIENMGYLYDHSDIKYNGLKRDVFYKPTEVFDYKVKIKKMLEQKADEMGNSVWEVIADTTNMFLGDFDICAVGDIIEYVDEDMFRWYGICVSEDTREICLFDKFQKKWRIVSAEDMRDKYMDTKVWINPQRILKDV